MRLISAQVAFALATTAVALVVRDESFNVTSVATSPVQSATPTDGPEVEEPVTTSRKADCPICRPKPEISVTGGFEDPSDTTTQADAAPSIVPSQPGVGDIINSYLTVSTTPAAHTERPTDGSDQASGGQPTRTGILHPPHMEASAPGGFVQATTAGNVQDTRPQVTLPPTPKPNSPPPEVTLEGVTLRPTPVTQAQVITVNGQPTTTNVVDFQYVVGSSTLRVGSTAVVNGVSVALNVGPDGSTVLVANDKTTTLPASVANMQAIQSVNGAQFPVSTTVQDGTTKYVLAGQTLAPGHAITVDNVPISFTTKDGTTVLVMGSVTTTLVASTTSSAGLLGTSVVSMPSNGRTQPTTTSVKGGANPARMVNPMFAQFVGLVGLILPLV